MARETLVGEVAKNKADAYRVTVKHVREGPVISVSLIHRHGGSELEVRGKAISLKPHQIAPMIEALRKAQDTAAAETATCALAWLKS